MSKIMYENLLTKLKNAAKSRKESMAAENGFKSVEDFKNYLENQIKNFKIEEKEELTDLVIAFDTTGSMGSYIKNVKEHVSKLIPESFKANKNLQISIVAFGDYCDMASPTTFGKAYQVINLTNDENALSDFVKNAQNTGGGDTDEFYELVIKKIVEKTSWRERSSKSVLLIGDCGPHELGYSFSPYVQNNQIDWVQECQKAAKLNIKIDTLSISGHSFYKKVAEITDGLCLPFFSSNKTSDLIESTVLSRGGINTRDAFYSKSMSSSVTSDAELNSVYKMYKTIVKEDKK